MFTNMREKNQENCSTTVKEHYEVSQVNIYKDYVARLKMLIL